MERAEKGEVEIVTSTLSVVEIAFAAQEKTAGQLDAALETRIDGLWVSTSPIKLVEFHFRMGQMARKVIRDAMANGWSIQAADAVHLASAMSMMVDEIHTYEDSNRRARWQTVTSINVNEPPPTPTPKLPV